MILSVYMSYGDNCLTTGTNVKIQALLSKPRKQSSALASVI